MQRLTRKSFFRYTRLLRRRFVPPWERDGKSADEFFSGFMQSANPMLTRQKQKERREKAERKYVEEASSPAELQRIEAVHAHNESVLDQQRNFLPYGAKPVVYFERSRMAALGEYEMMLQSSSVAAGAVDYSPAVREMLRTDLQQKLPYRYESYVEPCGNQALWPLHGTAGIVLDIDGVVYRSHKLIEGSDTAIRKMMELRIPLLFMTNGGGKSEEEKAKELSQLVGCEIDPSQIIYAQTPMQLLAPMYKDQNVLIVGCPRCAEVAKVYGFHRPISILQFQAEHPELVPYKKWGELKKCEAGTVAFPEISAILQFNDPDDAFSDLQTILDVLLSPRGQVGRYVSSTQCVPYFVSADDLFWATEAPLPRLGQGAFREMLSAVFESVTGHGLHVTTYGKPRAIAYAFAERRMGEISAKLGWDPKALRAIFMVGDNIDTDIVGANARGGCWTSVHVLSGIGVTPVARRTLAEDDVEFEWLEANVSKTPHYVAPTLDHFFRELLAFPESAMLQNKKPYYGMPNPVDLREQYNFPTSN
ncbi:HAD-superfamily subfamily IIA hydrolase [Trypanosoma rangeli]|uniref:HAD-superfamily subfamily IIA hydrolase n=1 Tax=Trypanosoma rangeli TaxID=5698 RepID=A0A3R7L7A5_TRYRA|nr:HAD-superfamily subfamily IIA hydrolase [Trypanosoma rangeli]RNF09023.1 HAD-superfamily subfamily IIA hydrolase [Trypanosoma rangeli]|eukprot:RNF09023.1 HAD-superfamily subfamily IIA hydrolase [Trypanosoma rangeli]